MSAQTEAAIAALAALIENSAPGVFKNDITRRQKFYTDLSSYPALFVRHVGNNYRWSGEGLQSIEIKVDIRIFTNEGANPDAVPDTSLNCLIDIVERALQPGPQDEAFQTLRTINAPNGLVYYARLEGEARFWPGDADMIAEATLPVSILLP